MARENKRIYEFGDFRIDTVNRRLMRDGETVPLKAKAVEALLVLIENQGDLVEKDELMATLWADSFVEESNLTQHIYTLRKAFGENEFIETVPRRGYRFIGDVRKVLDADDGDLIVVKEQTRVNVRYEEDDAEDVVPQLPPGPGGRRYWAAAIALGLLIAGVAIFFWLRMSQPAVFENAKLAKLTTSGNVIKAAVSPDGKYLAFVTNDRGSQGLWLRQIATGKDIAINQPAHTDYYGLTFTHDGSYLYFVSQEMNRVGILYRMPVLGGSPDKLVEDVDSPVTVAPDDKHLAFVRYASDEHGIVVTDADGTHERKAALSNKSSDFVLAPEHAVPPAWSPDGKTIACSVGIPSAEGNYETIWNFDAESGESRPLTGVRWEALGRMEWLQDGSGLIATAAERGSGFAQQIWHIGYPTGTTRKVTNDLSDYRDLSLAQDGKTIIAVQAERKANIFVAPMNDLQHSQQITTTNYDGLNGLAWTHDDRLIYTHRTTGEQNIWTVAAVGGEARRLTTHGGYGIDPNVSADDHSIIFAASTKGQSHIWRADIDGRNAVELTHGDDDEHPSFLPDGRIVYKAYVPGKPGLYVIPPDGGESVRYLEDLTFEPVVSPDGRLLAFGYRATVADRNKFAVMPIDGGEIRVICDLPAYYGQFTWMPDGTALAYADRQNPAGNIWAQPIDGGPPRQVTFWQPAPIYSFAFSPDGKKLAAAIGSQTSDAISIGDQVN